MGEKPRRFQTRARQVRSHGDDFEDFVFECFRIANEERGFAKHLARGRDGAIDLIDRFGEPGVATVAECKYVGSGLAKDAIARWREVFRHLSDHLPMLHANPDKNLKSQYRAWLEPDRPIKRYRFCVTATMSKQELAALEKRIVADFAKLVGAGVEPLRHLVEEPGAVRALPWDWFEAELEEHPSLAFRWFRGLPIGVGQFGDASGNEPTFQDFLTSGELRYFSRDQYESAGFGALERGEVALVTGLIHGAPQSLLITGPGGVGKTRLSWELAAALAGADDGFDVFTLKRSAGFESVTELAASYPGNASILLLIDYAEAAPKLNDIADAIVHLAAHSGHRVRLIATCRSSATNLVRDNLAALDPEVKGLGSLQTGEEAYVRWVSRSILALERFPQPEELERVCQGIPALAAFALFLFRRHREQFDRQFGALHGLSDFDKWVSHRVSLLSSRIGDRDASERMLARIAFALPLPFDRFQTMGGSYGAILDILRVDRWIELRDGYYVAAHDILADALAARWLFEAEHATSERSLDLLEEAAREQDLPHAMGVLARLASHPKFGSINGAFLVDALLERHPGQLCKSLALLLGTAILNFEQKLNLLHQHELARDAARAEPTLQVSLSVLAEESASRKLCKDDNPALATLGDLLDEVCDQSQISNIVLRRAYRFDQARFRDRVYANVSTFPQAESTHFLLVQMLRSGEPVDALHDPVKCWLQTNSRALRASFIYRAWLDAGGSLEDVSEALLSWVSEHGHTPEAQFVYKAWLSAGGRLEPVTAAVLAWLSVYGQTVRASLVYAAWLDAGGNLDDVSTALLTWVDSNGGTPEASYTYTGWLDAGGSPSEMAEAVLLWVSRQGQVPEAQFVYTSWLNAGGGTAAISEPLLSWLAAHGQSEAAGFVYRSWLNAGGEIAAITPFLLTWLDANGQSQEACFIYSAWLDAGGQHTAICKPLFGWLDKFRQAPEAAYVYSAWLEAGGDPRPIADTLSSWLTARGTDLEARHVYSAWFRAKAPFDEISSYVFEWVLKWSDNENLVYVTRGLCKVHNLPEPIVFAILNWSVKHIDHEDSLDRVATLCGHLHAGFMSESGLLKVIRELEDIIDYKLNSELLSEKDRSLIWSLCVSLRHPVFKNSNPYAFVRVTSKAVISRRIFAPGLGTAGAEYLTRRRSWVLMGIWWALRSGEVQVEDHQDAFAALASWVRTFELADTACEILRRMQLEFPSPAWGEMPAAAKAPRYGAIIPESHR